MNKIDQKGLKKRLSMGKFLGLISERWTYLNITAWRLLPLEGSITLEWWCWLGWWRVVGGVALVNLVLDWLSIVDNVEDCLVVSGVWDHLILDTGHDWLTRELCHDWTQDCRHWSRSGVVTRISTTAHPTLLVGAAPVSQVCITPCYNSGIFHLRPEHSTAFQKENEPRFEGSAVCWWHEGLIQLGDICSVVG